MAKITAKEVTVGMKFILVKHDLLGFPWEKDKDVLSSGYTLPLGSELTVTKVPYGRNNLIDFTVNGGTKEYTNFWGTFKDNTQYQSGTLTSKTGVVITSTGPFAGFDLSLKSTQLRDFSDCGFMILNMELEFIGTFTGAKKLSTKIINQIKTAPGFADACKKVLIDHLKSHEVEIKTYIAKTDKIKLKGSWQRQVGAPIHVNYKAGRTEFEISLTEDFDTVLNHIQKQVDHFVKAKTTSVRFFNER